MLQFRVELCGIENNVAHKVQCYSHLSVASEPCPHFRQAASDVEGLIPDEAHVTRANNKPIRLPAAS